MSTFRVIAWHTNMAAEILPTHANALTVTCGRLLTRQNTLMHTKNGAIIHMKKSVLRATHITAASRANIAYCHEAVFFE